MRIGIDMLATQAIAAADRGIGRYARGFVQTLLASTRGHGFVLYFQDGLPAEPIPASPQVAIEVLKPEPDRGVFEPREQTMRLSRINPDGLDVILTLDPFADLPRYEPSPRVADGPRTVSLVHDLIAFLEPESYLTEPRFADRMRRRLRRLADDDLLLTVSESTRRDCLQWLDRPAAGVVNVGGGLDAEAFRPDPDPVAGLVARRRLAALGINGSFLFGMAGAEARENLDGLILGFGELDPGLSQELQLIVVGALSPADRERFHRLAFHQGVADRVILAGEVGDEMLRLLYQRCAAFVFPSRYEGLAVPVLEAMRCGAPVVAGNHSSMPEIVGPAGLLVDVGDPSAIGAALRRLRTEGWLERRLRATGPPQASRFDWSVAVARALDAIERLDGSAGSPGRALGGPRRRVAWVGPDDPRDAPLVAALGERYRLDWIRPVVGRAREAGGDESLGASVFDPRLLSRLVRTRDYLAIVCWLRRGFSPEGLPEALRWVPGIVVLDESLADDPSSLTAGAWPSVLGAAALVGVPTPRHLAALAAAAPALAGRLRLIDPSAGGREGCVQLVEEAVAHQARDRWLAEEPA